MSAEVEIRRVRNYGWRPSLPDARDLVADTSELPVAPEVDPRGEYMTPVYDQGQLGSCTANAISAAIDADRIVNGEAPVTPARLAIYYFERMIEGSPLDQDTGAMGRDGLKAARGIGYLPEADWPYHDSTSAANFALDPRKDGHWQGDHVLLERPYKSVHRSAHAFKQVLSNRQTIAYGFTVYESFESREVASSGIVPVPQPGERVLGGHEVLAVGYLKDHPNHILTRNSWGESWGDNGYFLMPLQILLDPRMASDFRTIYRPAQ